jgi:hypothetical protein
MRRGRRQSIVLIALWRFVEIGVIPEGARLAAAQRSSRAEEDSAIRR